jgi:putative glycosyl hydrolase
MAWLRGLLAAALVAPAAGLVLGAAPAAAAPGMKVGLVDTAQAFWAKPADFYPLLSELRVQVLRVNLNWGGRYGVARRRPANPTNPRDRAYDWRLYDRIVLEARRRGVEIAFTIFGTPPWANGGAPPTRAPRNARRLEEFAYAAARRYSGRFRRADGRQLPAVKLWIAWNEPNLRLGLIPQYRRAGRRFVIQSALDYARICNAVFNGVHRTLLPERRVACGVTAPRGNDAPRSAKPSVSPLRFLRAMRKAGRVRFDAYAHQPYYGAPFERPSTRPRSRRAITLANIDVLVRELTRLYGRKRVWITEYGYQTSPEDPDFGVSWQRQARYLTQAFDLARRHPRIDLMLWFLLRDEDRVEGWQSGLVSAEGERKPSFEAFRILRR